MSFKKSCSVSWLLLKMDELEIPGLAVAVVQGKEIVFAKGLGEKSIDELKDPVTDETLFRIGSVTKMLTGIAFMRLADMGKVELDTPITYYISSLRGRINKIITPRMLMSHTSGLPDSPIDFFGTREKDGLSKYVNDHIPNLKMMADPGSIFHYSNDGINLLGYLAAIVSGKTFEEMMKELVFNPLEMNKTTFDPNVAMTYQVAKPHRISENLKLEVIHEFPENTFHYPGGFAISNVKELANVARMFINNGVFKKRRILSKQSVKSMLDIQTEALTTRKGSLGLTFYMFPYNGYKRIQQRGALPGYQAIFDMFPELDISIIMMSNRLSKGSTLERLSNYFYSKYFGLKTTRFVLKENEMVDKSIWKNFFGTYRNANGNLASIYEKDNLLYVNMDNDPIYIKPLYDKFYFGNGKNKSKVNVGFLFKENFSVKYIKINEIPYKRITQVEPLKN